MNISGVQFKSISFLSFLFICIFLFLPGTILCNEPSLYAIVTSNSSTSRETKTFSLDEKLYLDLLITDFTNGTELRIDWINPHGSVSDQFFDNLNKRNSNFIYRKRFKLKLPKLGFSSRVFSPQDYPDRYFGEWRIEFFLNNKKKDVLKFNMM